jgi:voltage-gated potassium channel Kch
MIGWLACFSFLIILASSLLLKCIHLGFGDHNTFMEEFWRTMRSALEISTLDERPGEEPSEVYWHFRLVAMFILLAGITIVSTLVGILTNSLKSKLEELQRGRSQVIEQRHSLILGWSPKIHDIIAELLIANENQRSAAIVILAEREKLDMDAELAMRFPKRGRTRIVCRSGSPMDLDVLRIVNPGEAKSIIILSPEGPHPDIAVIKTALAVTHSPRRNTSVRMHIVAEIQESENLEAAGLVGGGDISILDTGDLVSKVTAQTCRQSGLSVIYSEIFDFKGSEIYTKALSDPENAQLRRLVGKTYRECLHLFDSSSLIGLISAGNILLNPPMNTILRESDEIIVISEDDDTVKLDGKDQPIHEELLVKTSREEAKPERILMLGWNQHSLQIISELDHYVPAGSELMVASEDSMNVWSLDSSQVNSEGSLSRRLKPLEGNLQKLVLSSRVIDTTKLQSLKELDPASYDSIILLCNPMIDASASNARTIVTLLHLRSFQGRGGCGLKIVSELRDVRDEPLAHVARPDDFIVSDRIVAMVLAQISENRNLEGIFKELFSRRGSEIYLNPAGDYVQSGIEMDFHDVVHAAARRGESAIGFRKANASTDDKTQFGVRCNPLKSAKVTFSPADSIIVLAERQHGI